MELAPWPTIADVEVAERAQRGRNWGFYRGFEKREELDADCNLGLCDANPRQLHLFDAHRVAMDDVPEEENSV